MVSEVVRRSPCPTCDWSLTYYLILSWRWKDHLTAPIVGALFGARGSQRTDGESSKLNTLIGVWSRSTLLYIDLDSFMTLITVDILSVDHYFHLNSSLITVYFT